MSSAAEAFWRGQGGRDYTERNRVDWWARVPFWARVIAATRPRSVFEIGCNAGWNLMAIRALNWVPSVLGIDLNEQAVRQATEAGLQVRMGALADVDIRSDLVFTVGALIHIPPDHIEQAMRDIIEMAKSYVLAVEYEHGFEQEIAYRGERQLLWKRPFGQLYEAYGLELVDSWQAGPGFDNCTAWLLRK